MSINSSKLLNVISKNKYKNKHELPKKIRWDICTLCQLNCPCCFMRLNPDLVDKTLKLGYVSFDKFKKFIDDNDFIESIELSKAGEIFLNPDLEEIIKYADSKGVELTAYNGVNLNTLSDSMAETLVKHNFNRITVSIDGASNETYPIYRVRGNFEKVIENIEKINYFKKKYKKTCPNLTWKFIIFGHNEHEIPLAKEFAKKLNMDIAFDLSWENKFSPIKDPEFIIKNSGLKHLFPNGESFLMNYKQDSKAYIFCKELWQNPQINWDGQILGCCACNFDNFGVNVFEDGLFNALNNDKLCLAKAMLKRQILPVPGVPCHNCYFYFRLVELNLKIDDDI